MAKRGQVAKGPVRDTDERPTRWRRYSHLFLIVCEDSKTEPYYFEKFSQLFPEETLFLRAVGTGQTWDDVVKRALFECKLLGKESKKHIDEVWAVFDTDDAATNAGTVRKFESAFEIAKNERIRIAFSNEVFELWLLLHLKDINPSTQLPRAEIYSTIESEIRRHDKYKAFAYEHGKTEVIDIIQKIGNESKAIQRAEHLYSEKKEHKPIESNPNTTVFILIKKLRELIQYYSRTL